MNRTFARFIFCLILGASAAVPASAGTITHTDYFSLPNKTLTTTSYGGQGYNVAVTNEFINLPLFDSSRGHLQSAQVDFDTRWFLFGEASGYGRCHSQHGGTCGVEVSTKSTVKNDLSIRLLSPLVKDIDGVKPQTSMSCNVSGGTVVSCLDSSFETGQFDTVFSPAQDKLGLFSGSGQLRFLLHRWMPTTVDACSANGGEKSTFTYQQCSAKSSTNSWAGTFSVTYTYEESQGENGNRNPGAPNTVPAPGGLALFAAGLAGLGFLSRRRVGKYPGRV